MHMHEKYNGCVVCAWCDLPSWFNFLRKLAREFGVAKVFEMKSGE